MRITSVTPMKNEAPFLLEWVAYHRMIGVNDMLVFSNDCTDGTNLMLERLDEMGVLRHYPNPSMYLARDKHHLQVIRYINTSERLPRSDWVVSFDVDEFICVNTGKGHLEDLFNAVPDANMIVMNQHNFGCSDIVPFEDALLTRQFQYAWDKEKAYHARLNRRGTKTLTHQSAEAKAWHNHSPVFHGDKLDKVHCVNGSGIRQTEQDFTKDIKSLLHPHFGFDLVQLNHYALRAVETYMLKVDRGNANHADAKDAMAYWRRYDNNDLHDTNIQRMTDDIDTARDELLKDAELKSLHTAAVDVAQRRIAAFKKQPEMQSLLSKIKRYRENHTLAASSA
ncbi:glycosyltransferase family 2 protein [Pseudooctadecabacter jejudonensis]|uniref:Glycosyl transferase family 2 n=1 Tax=Pseudooctadecabacter jejudonensis TaxID=1391910 RepID=A0A1Y5RH88_9RHOB|nr:glycosyltransferase family 2 protein [Pseudooctadecabacter jejudonensis]SLN17324.1 hypothetical protein PSJ8397_00542 [Pseudooctadecabacter jejudonensis]